MKNYYSLFSLFILFLLFPSCNTGPDLSTDWKHPMYLGINGFWKQRVAVVVVNNTEINMAGDPVTLTVGKGQGKLPLKGVMAESIRVTNSKGEELKCRVDDPKGKLIERGAIPDGGVVTIPLENEAGEEAKYYVYFDNDAAWAVGEYLFTHREVSNGGFESEAQFGPLNWELDWPQDDRDVIWSESESYSGSRSIEILSERATDPDRSSRGRRSRGGSYGASQSDIHLIPGASYEVEAWFKTENLEGEAGLTLFGANLARTKSNVRSMPARLSVDASTQDWQHASVEFTADEETNILSIGTFISGKGKIWIDDVKLNCNADYNLAVEVLPVEKLPATEPGKTEQWMGSSMTESVEWPVRAAVTVPNFTDAAFEAYPVYVDIQMLKQRLFNEIDENTLMQLTDGTEPIPYLELGNAIMFKQDIPAFSNRTFYLYFADRETTEGTLSVYDDLSQITENLVANPQFDEADVTGWERFGESDSKMISADEEDGNPLVQLSFAITGDEKQTKVSDIEESHTVLDTEIGIFQEYDVNPGSKYFFSARVKSSDILDRTFTLRAGFLDENGDLVEDKETRRANPDMHQNYEWVKESMIIQAPLGASSVKIELVNTVKGKVWYDDVYFMEVGTGYTGAMSVERKAEKDVEGLEVWEKAPIAKAFPDDLPDKKLEKIIMSAARYDVESAQILMRSQNEYKDIEVVLGPLTDDNGNKLEEIEIGVVGYVPISYPSNYIRDFVTPFWQTILPFGTIGSDGWIGWWADPILPFSKFDLPANKTKAAWIEVSVPDNATAGLYTGNVQLVQNGSVLKDIPLEMQVYDFTLPKESNVKATYVTRFNNREIFGRDLTSSQWRDELWKYMAKHRVSHKMVEPEPEMSFVNGEVIMDFTEFDKAAAYYFDTLKIASTYSPQFFYLFGWGRPPSSKFGENPYPGEYPYYDANHLKLRPEYKRIYQSAMRQYWNHMKEKGWSDRVVIYISDEPHDEEHMNNQMYAVCDMIHEVDPKIKIYVSTWWYRPEFEGYVDVWGVSHRGGGWGHPVPAEHLRLAVQNGGDVFFTTDGMQCTDSPFLGFERLLPYFCFKYEAKEYEFWASNWHTLDPYNYGWHRFHRQSPEVDVVYWMRYPNGDGNFIYPGALIGADEPLVPSVRLKQAREGIEDFEFMNILDQLIKKGNSKGIETTEATAALDRAKDLVTIPCADGRYTTDYVPDPALLAEIRHDIGLAIEDLSEKLK
ncbi:DUF4091 domain-containing protein [Bacteroidota bacterium]